MARAFCRACGKPQIAIGGYNLSDTCAYCGSSLDDQVVEDTRENSVQSSVKSRAPHPATRRMNVVHCWFCDYPNGFNNRQCDSCGANLFAVTKPIQEEDMNKRFVAQLTPSEQNMFLIEGLKALIAAILKREGNEDGMVRCQNRGCHGGMYHYTEFTCPRCDGPSLLQEMRGVITGVINNGDISRELQKSFPQFNIMKYTNSAVMDHRQISAAKIDLEDAARETASMLRTGAEFLKAVTYTGKRKRSVPEVGVESVRSGGISDMFDMGGVNLQPDTRVMDILDATAINADAQQAVPEVAADDDIIDEELPPDWTNP